MDDRQLIDAFRDNYRAYFRLFDGQHGIRFLEEDGFTCLVANGPPGNHLLRAHLADGEVDVQIDRILGQIARYTGGMRWLVFPHDRPADLAARLAAHGLEAGSGDDWMFVDLSQGQKPPGIDGLRVARVVDLPGLRRWWTVSAAGFELSAKQAQVWYDAYRTHGLGDERVRHYVAWQGEQPVSSATLILEGAMAGIYDVSTPPALRRKGYAAAVTWAAMQDAHRHGFLWAGLVTGSAQSLYARLGFGTRYREQEFFWSGA